MTTGLTSINGVTGLPQKILAEMEQATRMPHIRPETTRDTIMYYAGMRHAYTILCAKLGVRSTDTDAELAEG